MSGFHLRNTVSSLALAATLFVANRSDALGSAQNTTSKSPTAVTDTLRPKPMPFPFEKRQQPHIPPDMPLMQFIRAMEMMERMDKYIHIMLELEKRHPTYNDDMGGFPNVIQTIDGGSFLWYGNPSQPLTPAPSALPQFKPKDPK